MKTHSIFILLAATSCLFSSPAEAKVYRVGDGQEYSQISQVAGQLEPGDIVEVSSDISDSVKLTRSGTREKPIIITGVPRKAGKGFARPVVTPGADKHVMICCGNWTRIEGLEFRPGSKKAELFLTCLYHSCDGLTIRNCRFAGFPRKAIQGSDDAGSIVLEFCEFDSNGAYDRWHTIDVLSHVKGATATVQHCYFHDGTGGQLLKSHCPRNLIRYNWFEAPYYSAVQIVSMLGNEPSEEHIKKNEDLFPMHTDIVGNVFFQGWSPGSRYSILAIGGEDESAPGTEGDFNIAHNLFVTTNGAISPAVPLRVNGNVDRVRVYNNIYMEYGVKGCQVYLRGKTWDCPRTQAFIKRRGSGEPVVEGSNNWISEKSTDVPKTFAGTLRGLNPRFVDMLKRDFRPRKDSPLAGAGAWPLPSGRMVVLAPEYEPQRGIPVDLKPRPRRKVTPPSIGPFEVAE